jgi:uncharacterized protein (DUF302 family)
MKTVISLAMALLVLTGAMTRDANASQRSGWVSQETDMAYGALVKRLNSAVKAEKMLLVSRASASSGAKGRKIIIPGNMVVGVYRNDFALRMLKASVDAGIEAPIRFYITERGDGGASLSYKKPSFVFAPYMEDAKPELAVLATELDEIFAAIAQRAIAED